MHAYFRCTLILDARCGVRTRARHCRIRLTGCVGKHLTWVRASWPLTHGQAGSRWQRGAGCSTSRSSVATCNATGRAASAFSCWLCFVFLFSSKESPPSLDFDLRLRSFDGSSRVLFYVDPVVLSLHGIIPRPLRPLRRHFIVPLRHHRPPLQRRRRHRQAPTSVATSRWLRFSYYQFQVSSPYSLSTGTSLGHRPGLYPQGGFSHPIRVSPPPSLF